MRTKLTSSKQHQAAANHSSGETQNNNAIEREGDHRPETTIQRQLQASADKNRASKPNQTGLPDQLKQGIESLSGHSMDDVKVHYNSSMPSKLQAHAYAQGTEIHLASGQEKHLPHEAWHVVQQKQGRVKPTLTTKSGAQINDDIGLEKEADTMGAKAKSTANTRQLKSMSAEPESTIIQKKPVITIDKSKSKEGKADANPAPIQLEVAAVYVDGTKLPVDRDKEQSRYKALDLYAPNFKGEAWFNSEEELEQWIQSKGKMEGIGPWDGKWMNFTGKGPIVYGEEHNAIREAFIGALHITHRLVEGAAERSLTGVPDQNIPEAKDATESHKKYNADEGKALENYWLRAAQYMSYYYVKLESDLRQCFYGKESMMREIEHLDSLIELIDTILNTKPVVSKDKTAKEINIRLRVTQGHLKNALKTGLNDLLIEAKKRKGRAWKFFTMQSFVPDYRKSGKGKDLLVHFSCFKESVEHLGYLNFKANATQQDMESDAQTKDDPSALKVWAGRRELFMLKNLAEALTKNPKPLITTMGAAHAKNQKDKITAMLGNGKLIIGDITEVAAYGAAKP